MKKKEEDEIFKISRDKIFIILNPHLQGSRINN